MTVNFTTWKGITDGQTYGIPDSVVDDFERGDLQPYSGDLGPYDVTQTDVPEGDFALEIDDGASGDIIYSEPGDGLDYYPEKGDQLACLLNDVASEDGETYRPEVFIAFKEDNGSNGYGVRIDSDSNSFQIRKHVEGSADVESGESVSIASNEWYWIEIEWHDGSGSESNNEIVGRLFEIDAEETPFNLPSDKGSELASFSTNDVDFADNRGVAFGVGSSLPNDAGSMADWYVKLHEVSD